MPLADQRSTHTVIGHKNNEFIYRVLTKDNLKIVGYYAGAENFKTLLGLIEEYPNCVLYEDELTPSEIEIAAKAFGPKIIFIVETEITKLAYNNLHTLYRRVNANNTRYLILEHGVNPLAPCPGKEYCEFTAAHKQMIAFTPPTQQLVYHENRLNEVELALVL